MASDTPSPDPRGAPQPPQEGNRGARDVPVGVLVVNRPGGVELTGGRGWGGGGRGRGGRGGGGGGGPPGGGAGGGRGPAAPPRAGGGGAASPRARPRPERPG